MDLDHIEATVLPRRSWLSRQSGGERGAGVVAHPGGAQQFFLRSLSSLCSATGAAGGRWWVSCSLATLLVEGGLICSFVQVSLSLSLSRARKGDAGTKRGLIEASPPPSPQRRGRTNISAQRSRGSGPESVTPGRPSSVEGWGAPINVLLDLHWI